MLTTSITFLGKIISHGCIRPHPKRAKDIIEMELPHNLQQLRALLGIANQVREFISNFDELVRPLFELTQTSEVPKTSAWRKSNNAVKGKKVIIK
jgi:hypothetical protein